jgi:hypothetical protein
MSFSGETKFDEPFLDLAIAVAGVGISVFYTLI